MTKTDDTLKTTKADGDGDRNESDESSVYDIPPPKRQKKGETGSESEKKSKRKSDSKDNKKVSQPTSTTSRL